MAKRKEATIRTMRNTFLFLAVFAAFSLPNVALAAVKQPGFPALQRVKYHEMSASVPAKWNSHEADDMESVYRAYTPLAASDRRGNLTSIHLSRDANTSEYSTLEGAVKLLTGGSTNMKVVATKEMRFAGMPGYEIHFKEMNCREIYCPSSVVEHVWRFGRGKDHFYVVGLNGTTKFVKENRELFERVFKTVRVKQL